MTINVLKVAKLANLSLTAGEKEKLEKQLSSILDYINKLNEVDTKNVKESPQVNGLENVTREDKTAPSLSQEEVLANTSSKQNELFKVKAVFDNE